MTQRKKWNNELVLLEIKKLAIRLKRKPAKRDNNSLYFLSRKYFGTWNNALKAAGFEVKQLQKPKIPSKLTPELAYFIGLLVTDGHISKDKLKRHKVMLFTSYSEEKELILNLIKKIFNYNASIASRKCGFNKRLNYSIYVSSNLLARYFIEKFQVPSGAKSCIIRVPKILFNTNKSNIAAFIGGVIDGDGGISNNRIYISSGSSKFLKDIKKLFNNFGISSGKVRSKAPYNPNTFELGIYCKDGVKRLYDLIYMGAEFFYPRKKKSWEDLKVKLHLT